MTKRRQVPTAARIATLGVLAAMRPRTPLPTLTLLVDGAAVLVEANEPAETVRLMLASLRLKPEQEAEALVGLYRSQAVNPLHLVAEAEMAEGGSL